MLTAKPQQLTLSFQDGLEVTAARRFLTIRNRCLTPVFLLLALCLLTTVTDADAAIGQVYSLKKFDISLYFFAL